MSIVSSTAETFNINDKYTQNFIMHHLTTPLARKLAIAAFMDFSPGVEQTHYPIYNAGSIILDYDRQGSNHEVPVMKDSVKSSDFRPKTKWWRRFISFINKPKKVDNNCLESKLYNI